MLKCNNHTSKLYEWKLLKDEVSLMWKNVVNSSKMHQLRRISYREVDKVLVTTFVKRWHRKTNTFHMPFGEMTIILDDVHCHKGLPAVTRHPLVSAWSDSSNCIDYAREWLGVSHVEVVEGM